MYPGVEIPQSVQAAILSRIDRLSPTDKMVLRAASVIGRSFDCSILAEVLEPDLTEIDLDRAFAVLEQRRFLCRSDNSARVDDLSENSPRNELSDNLVVEARMSSACVGIQMAFRQSMTLDVTYNSLLKAERKRLHGKVGEAMEKLYSNRIGDVAPILSYHFEKAQIPEKSIKYLQLTGTQAVELFALDQAQELFEKAFCMAEDLDNKSIPTEVLVGLNQGIGDVFHFRSEYDKALRYYETAAKSESHPHRRSALYRKMGKLMEKSGRYDAAREYLQKGLDELKEDYDLKEAGRSYAALCLVYYRLGDLDTAAELGNLAHLMNERNQDKLGSAQAHNNLGIVMAKRGDPVSAEIHYESARRIWEEMGDRYGLASCCNNLGLLANDQKNWSGAIEHFRKSENLFLALNNRHGLARVYDNLSQVYYQKDEVEKAQEYLEKGLEIMAEIGVGRDGLLPEMWQSGIW
jgi:tetratricopeptide (TPR) repeat protein